MPRREHRAALLLLALAVVGHGARLWLAPSGPIPPGAIGLPADPAGPARWQSEVRRLTRPLGATERVDLDRAGVAELSRLPGVGPALARAIVADREARGAFGSLQGLDRVPGVGPALLARVGPHAAFSGRPLGGAGESGVGRSDGLVDLNRATESELQRLPGIGPARARAIVAYRESHGPFASLDSLRAIPGVGAALVNRLRGLAVVR